MLISEFPWAEKLDVFSSVQGDALHSTGYERSIVYYFGSVSAGHWIGFESMEFRADERLSGDEVAQAIFTLSGGVDAEVAGQLGAYRVEYCSARPATLTLVQTHEGPGQPVPRLYYAV